MLSRCDVLLNASFDKSFADVADKIIYTGAIDEYFDFALGKLEYRTLRFEICELNTPDFQGNAVVNYTSKKVPYTRIIEHKHFEFGKQKHTIITKEYPQSYIDGAEKFYPVNDEKNETLYSKYIEYAEKEKNVYFCGRLGKYGYFDMDKTIENALHLSNKF